MTPVDHCTYCGQDLPDPFDQNNIPVVCVFDSQMEPMLWLHATCIPVLIQGLKHAERMTMN